MQTTEVKGNLPTDEPIPYLLVDNVGKTYGDNRVLQDIHFTAAQGDVVSILGPSGSGKSTLLRIVAGLELPDGGFISCDNSVYYSDKGGVHCPVQRRDIGMVFQDFGLWPHLTAQEHVAFPLWSRRRRGHLKASRSDIKEQAMEALRMFRMERYADAKPHSLSGGQQQRIAFARTVVARPRLVLLDEAFSALDPQLRTDVRTELVSVLRDHRMTVLSVTHDQEEAMAISDRILVLQHGSQLQYAPPEELYERPRDVQVATFVGRGNVVPARYDGNVTLHLPGWQSLPLAEPLPLYRGRNVDGHLLIRPESIRLVETTSQAQNVAYWTGKVRQYTSLIGRTELQVEVESVGQLLLYHREKIPVGTEVALQVQIRRPHFIAQR